jgi:hypothetical protein
LLDGGIYETYHLDLTRHLEPHVEEDECYQSARSQGLPREVERHDRAPRQRGLQLRGRATAGLGRPPRVIAYMDPPGIARAISCESSQALRLHAYIRPVRWRPCWPPGLDGFRALPPPHLNDLLAVYAISRVWKSWSDLLCHAYVTTHAIIW